MVGCVWSKLGGGGIEGCVLLEYSKVVVCVVVG